MVSNSLGWDLHIRLEPVATKELWPLRHMGVGTAIPHVRYEPSRLPAGLKTETGRSAMTLHRDVDHLVVGGDGVRDLADRGERRRI